MLKTVKDGCKVHPSTLNYQVSGGVESLAQMIDAQDEGRAFFEKSYLTRWMEELLREGLNLQRLGTLINVDLPWNPTRLEQRIGRIKRFGQTRSTVDMLNLVYQNTVDENIYERLSARMKDRFDLFGSLPDTIEDSWIDNVETLDEKLDEYINTQKRVNGFDIRYNENLDAEEDEWRNCAQVLSRRSIDTLMRNGW